MVKAASSPVRTCPGQYGTYAPIEAERHGSDSQRQSPNQGNKDDGTGLAAIPFLKPLQTIHTPPLAESSLSHDTLPGPLLGRWRFLSAHPSLLPPRRQGKGPWNGETLVNKHLMGDWG